MMAMAVFHQQIAARSVCTSSAEKKISSAKELGVSRPNSPALPRSLGRFQPVRVDRAIPEVLSQPQDTVGAVAHLSLFLQVLRLDALEVLGTAA